MELHTSQYFNFLKKAKEFNHIVYLTKRNYFWNSLKPSTKNCNFCVDKYNPHKNSQAVKKGVDLKILGEKRREIKGGDQQMAAMM